MEEDKDELTVEQLDNVIAGVDYLDGLKNVLDHPDIYPAEYVEKAKQEYDELCKIKQEEKFGRGR